MELHSTEGRTEVLRRFNDYFHFGGFPEGATLSVKRDYLTSTCQKIYLGDIISSTGAKVGTQTVIPFLHQTTTRVSR